MSQTIDELGVAPEITQPLAIKDSGDIGRFNEASARNLQDMRSLSLYLKDDFVPKMNAARPHLNMILPYADNIRSVAESISNVNTLTPALPDVQTLTSNLPAVQTVSVNIDAVIAALAHARTAKQEADRAKGEADRAEAISGIGLSTPEIAGLSRPGSGLAVDVDGKYSVQLGDFLSLSSDGKINAAHPTVVVVTPTIDTGNLIAIGQGNEFRVSSSSSLVGVSVASFSVEVTELGTQEVSAADNTALVSVVVPADMAVGKELTITVTATDAYGNKSFPATHTVTTVNAFVVAPTLTAPVADAQINRTYVTFGTSTFACIGMADTHIASEYRIRDMSGNVVYISAGNTTDLTAHVATAPSVVLGQQYILDVRHRGQSIGWSAWSAPVTVTIRSVGHGVRTVGGIMIGDANGNQITFKDGKKGYLVVPPASQRKAGVKWGLYGTDTSLTNFTSSGFTDDKTGIQNTNVLTSSTYSSVNDGQGSIGAPAATYCQNLEFEGCTDYFLPNLNELLLIQASIPLIDSVDETVGEFPSLVLTNWFSGGWAWSSSEYNTYNAWVALASGSVNNNYKDDNYGVVPSRRFIP